MPSSAHKGKPYHTGAANEVVPFHYCPLQVLRLPALPLPPFHLPKKHAPFLAYFP